MSEDPDNKPISSIVGERGIKTSGDFADFMSGLMADLVSGRIGPDVAKAACMAGEALLRVSKMQLEFNGQDESNLPLTGDDRRLAGKKLSSKTDGK
jgi:hypothetical protein